MCPVLIISYEMFRKHASLLNEVPHLDVIICDEGHRLKNSGGTKTIQALSGCKATKRIVLSGTPIQNDLEELYSVVSFVVPRFLGSLARFKSTFAVPINRGREPDATGKEREVGTRASARLRALLAQIMLRRTQQVR
jgi:SNF2 family DNA or RNA helicase